MEPNMEPNFDYYSWIRNNNLSKIRASVEADPQILSKVMPYGQSLVLLSVLERRNSILKFLIEQGCNLNQGDRERGLTPLQAAVLHNNFEAAEMLIEAKAIVNVEDKYGNTPLLDAVHTFQDDLSIIRLLLSSGADPLHQNYYGVSPYSLSQSTGKYQVINLLKEQAC
jgi:uncharacterized protein